MAKKIDNTHSCKQLSIQECLQTIQQRLKVGKDKTNQFGKFKYRSLADLYEAVKPILNGLNCTLTISDEVQLIGDRFYIVSTATLANSTDSISVRGYAREDFARSGMSESQCTGTAMSYAHKYTLGNLFCIDDSVDADEVSGDSNDKSILVGAIALMNGALTLKDAGAIWSRYKHLQSNPEFIAAKENAKKRIHEQGN